MTTSRLNNIYPNQAFFLIAGPCVVENETMVLSIAETIATITQQLGIPYIFKASYRKANRSKHDSFMGIGDDEALKILEKVKTEFNLPVLTDIHATNEARWAADVVDILQIPAFLCRQTDILEAAAKTGKVVNVKKGQFLSPESMLHVVNKVKAFNGESIWLTDRGTMFGYQDLIVDFRGIPIMKQMGVPVIMDCTHSLQQPNQNTGVTGGLPSLIQTIAAGALAVGADGLFIETHPEPSKALSDGANMLPLAQLESLLKKLILHRHAYLEAARI